MSEDLLYEVKDYVAQVTIRREARRNALSEEMITAFVGHLEQADQDTDVRALCLTGTGEKAFCSGADLASAFTAQGEERLKGPREYARLLKTMIRFNKPSVARVNGPCLAGGIGLMLACDMVIARNDTFFCTPEVNVGIFPMMVGALLYRNVGRKKAVEMVLTGRKVSALEAERMGLITRAVEPGNLDDEIQKTLALLTSKSPIGIRIGKEAFRVMSDMAFEPAIDHLCDALGQAVSTEDAVEGMTAFIQKRSPRFKGR